MINGISEINDHLSEIDDHSDETYEDNNKDALSESDDYSNDDDSYEDLKITANTDDKGTQRPTRNTKVPKRLTITHENITGKHMKNTNLQLIHRTPKSQIRYFLCLKILAPLSNLSCLKILVRRIIFYFVHISTHFRTSVFLFATSHKERHIT